jgi:hypothetical protein
MQLDVLQQLAAQTDPELLKYENAVDWNDDLETAGGIVSKGDDEGAWVLAWVWVPDAHL